MKASNFACLALATLISSMAAADPIVIAVPWDAKPLASTLTRAEVIADLQMWRLAGLQEFSRPDQRLDDSERYRAAEARYLALKSSPQFAALVERLKFEPSATVVAR